MRRLTPTEQHKINANIILGRKSKNLASPSMEAAKLDPEEKENRQGDSLGTHEDLMKYKKAELQEVCITREIPFEDNFNKSQLADMILKGTTDV